MGNCIVVLGMHRSGTSALAGALWLSGVYLGGSCIADHYEHEFSVNLNSRLLADLGSSWDDVFMLPDRWWHGNTASEHRRRLEAGLRQEFANRTLWGVKDPRLCVTLPLWLEVFANLNVKPHFVIALRHPAEICKSHQRRDGFSPQKAILIWLNYLLSAVRYTRHFTRCFMRYEDLLCNPQAYLERIQRKLDLNLPRPWAAAENDLLAFIDPGLKHHHERLSVLPADIPEFASELWILLQKLCHSRSGVEAVLESIDEIDAEYRKMHSFFLNSQLKSDMDRYRDKSSKAMNLLSGIGQDFVARGRPDDAVKHYRQMVEVFPRDIRMHNNLGFAYECAGDFCNAKECYRTALKIEPLYAIAGRNLARLNSG